MVGSILSALGNAIVENLPSNRKCRTDCLCYFTRLDCGTTTNNGRRSNWYVLVQMCSITALIEAALQMIATLVSGIGSALRLIPAAVQAIVTVAD